ncbi:MAG TPA: hypothetical protein VF942_08860 [Acidimicrobiales bacterium]
MSASTIREMTVEANGLRFGCLTSGEDTDDDCPLALCLHGFPDSAWTWRYLLPDLATSRTKAEPD